MLNFSNRKNKKKCGLWFDKLFDAYKKGLTLSVVEYSNNIFELDPDNEIGLHVKAWWYRGESWYNDGSRLLSNCIAYEDKLIEMDQADISEKVAANLDRKEAIGKFKAAKVCFNKVISLEPGNGTVDLFSGIRTVYENGLPSKKIVVQTISIGLSARYRKGETLIKMGDLEESGKNEERAKKNHKEGAKALKDYLKIQEIRDDDEFDITSKDAKMRELITLIKNKYDENDAHDSF